MTTPTESDPEATPAADAGEGSAAPGDPAGAGVGTGDQLETLASTAVVPAAKAKRQDPVFEVGDRVLLIDRKKRRNMILLEEGGEWHSHAGVLAHGDIIGQPEGVQVKSSHGLRLHCIKPTLSDFVLKMKRGAQVIYPKDLGPLLMLADIAPGVQVLESGVGSGALSMTMLRAGAIVTGYEIRDDFARRAQRNVESYLGEEAMSRYHVEVRSSYEQIDGDYGRCVLDLPEPWQVVPHAATALHRGGIIVAYTPQITQAVRFREVLERYGFGMSQTIEVMQRGWHIDGQAVRPDHRMVAHTGFLTSARLMSDPTPPGKDAATNGSPSDTSLGEGTGDDPHPDDPGTRR